MAVSDEEQDPEDKFASKLAKFELLSKRTLPFRHPDFTDEQIKRLTDVTRPYRSGPSSYSSRRGTRHHSGCSSPILSPTVQRLRAEGFPPLARAGSDPVILGMHGIQILHTGSLPTDYLPCSSARYNLMKKKDKRDRHLSNAATKDLDKDAYSSLIERLSEVEAQCAAAQQALRQKDFYIAVLEEKFRLYAKAEEEAISSRTDFFSSLKETRVNQLEVKYRKLEYQLMEMERFLGECGMVWCEEEGTYHLEPYHSLNSSSSSEGYTPAAVSPVRSPRPSRAVRIKRNRKSVKGRRTAVESTSRSISSEAEPYSLDYDKLFISIAELNMQTENEESNTSVQMTFYKNGLVVDDGEFRSFEKVETRRFAQDLLDGCIPAELKEATNEGVSIKVRDKRQVIHMRGPSPRRNRPPVPPKPKVSEAALTGSSLTSGASQPTGSVSEVETQEEAHIEPSHLYPEVIDIRSGESSDMCSRRNSMKGSDKSEWESKPEASPPTRRCSEVFKPAAELGGRRESRRASETRRGSEIRMHSCRRSGGECRRSASKHPLEWNRINRPVFFLPEDSAYDLNGNQMRRGSVGVVVGGGMTMEPYDMEAFRKRRTSVEDFLSKVPTCIVKGGKIVNLREEFADMLMGAGRKSSLTLVHTPALDEVGESQESNEQDEDSKAEEKPKKEVAAAVESQPHSSHDHSRTVLRIRVENGTETYMIKLKATDTLQTLRSYLKSYRGDDDEFSIVRSYPFQVLDQDDATMAQLGLIPNAALHLKCSKTSQNIAEVAAVSVTTSETVRRMSDALITTMAHSVIPSPLVTSLITSSHSHRRSPFQALPKIPPNLHPEIPVTTIPDLSSLC